MFQWSGEQPTCKHSSGGAHSPYYCGRPPTIGPESSSSSLFIIHHHQIDNNQRMQATMVRGSKRSTTLMQNSHISAFQGSGE